MHQIDIDRAKRIISVRLLDWIELAEARQLVIAKGQAVMSLGLPFKGHCCLVDVRELRILPQETISLFVDLVADQQYKAQRVAFLAGAGSVKMQIRRLVCHEDNRERYRIFESAEQAELWLCEQDRRAA